MLTHAEKIAAVPALVLLLAVVVAWLFDRYVLVVSWWPLVGRQWRTERRDTLDLPGPMAEQDGNGGHEGAPDRAGEPDLRPASMLQPVTFGDWDDEPSTDDDADAMIAAWHGDDGEQDQLAAVHPIYLDLSDDPDLIVWDAKQQADRCWEIVHVEFPRLRAELAGMWEAAA